MKYAVHLSFVIVFSEGREGEEVLPNKEKLLSNSVGVYCIEGQHDLLF